MVWSSIDGRGVVVEEEWKYTGKGKVQASNLEHMQ